MIQGTEKGSILRDFGSTSALLEAADPSFLAVEISGKGTKKITSILAQYARQSAADVTNIKSGRLLVVRGDIANLGLPVNPDNYGIGEYADIIFEAQLVDFQPAFFSFLGKNLESSPDATISVLLFFPASDTGNEVIGRLTVLGDSTSNQLKGVSINAN